MLQQTTGGSVTSVRRAAAVGRTSGMESGEQKFWGVNRCWAVQIIEDQHFQNDYHHHWQNLKL